MSKRPRPRRVAIRGATIQIASTVAEMLNVSRTGALIRLNYQPRTGGEWPLVLDLPAVDDALWLTGRVVRCRPAEPHAQHLSVTERHYLTALKFIDPSPEAQAILDGVCGTLAPVKSVKPVARALPSRGMRKQPVIRRLRRLSLSIRRRCPECRSVDVMKNGRHRYTCKQCGREFSGLRFGPLRLAF
jgi:hypothetical protein